MPQVILPSLAPTGIPPEPSLDLLEFQVSKAPIVYASHGSKSGEWPL